MCLVRRRSRGPEVIDGEACAASNRRGPIPRVEGQICYAPGARTTLSLMRLDPVYLVAPAPEPPKVTRRAAILACIGTAVSCLAIGFGSASVLSRQSGRSNKLPGEAEDANLSWALELQRGPQADLIEHHRFFLAVVELDEPHRERLWRGVGRLVEAVSLASDLEVDNRRSLARLLLPVIRRPDAPADLQARAAEIQIIAGG